MILDYVKKINNNVVCFDDLDPVVSAENNFDRLLFPPDHPARK